MTFFELIGALIAAIAVLGYVNDRFLKLPHTIGITAMALLLSLALTIAGHYVPEVVSRAVALAHQLDFYEVVFHGLLGFLLFAGSLHINISDLHKQRIPVLVLSTVGVGLSTLLVGYGTHALLGVFGIVVSLSHCFLFGALISPTDPVAVLSVLKTAGVPKALETKIAGESLFNDGTGVVAFLVLLGIVTGSHEPTVASVSLLLLQEVVGALVFGLACGWLAVLMIRGIDNYSVEIFITLALATGGYSVAERLHVSAPLAVVVMGLVIGNLGARHAMSASTRARLFPFWEVLDEGLNLVLFGLIGVKMLSIGSADVRWVVAAALLPVVLAARFASVGLPVFALRRWLKPSPHTVKVLTWGGLRGAISVALALSLPQFEGRELFITATYGVVLFSLLVQAPTLGPLLKWLGIGTR